MTWAISERRYGIPCQPLIAPRLTYMPYAETITGGFEKACMPAAAKPLGISGWLRHLLVLPPSAHRELRAVL